MWPGADLAKFCNEAAVHAGSNKHEYVTQNDFEYAAEKIILGKSCHLSLDPSVCNLNAYF